MNQGSASQPLGDPPGTQSVTFQERWARRHIAARLNGIAGMLEHEMAPTGLESIIPRLDLEGDKNEA